VGNLVIAMVELLPLDWKRPGSIACCTCDLRGGVGGNLQGMSFDARWWQGERYGLVDWEKTERTEGSLRRDDRIATAAVGPRLNIFSFFLI
jgi:hypothetical protein